MPTSSLLILPLELRLQIYTLVLVCPSRIAFNPRAYPCPPTSLLLTCRKIHTEASPVLYGSNKFIFVPPYDDDDWVCLATSTLGSLTGFGSRNLSYVRDLTLDWTSPPAYIQEVNERAHYNFAYPYPLPDIEALEGKNEAQICKVLSLVATSCPSLTHLAVLLPDQYDPPSAFFAGNWIDDPVLPGKVSETLVSICVDTLEELTIGNCVRFKAIEEVVRRMGCRRVVCLKTYMVDEKTGWLKGQGRWSVKGDGRVVLELG